MDDNQIMSEMKQIQYPNQPPPWKVGKQPKKPNQAYLNYLKSNKSEKAKQINQVIQEDPYGSQHYTFGKVLDDYKSQNKQLLDLMDKITTLTNGTTYGQPAPTYSDIRQEDPSMTYNMIQSSKGETMGALNQLIAQKGITPSFKNEKFKQLMNMMLQKHGLQPDSVPHKRLRMMLAADDFWTSVAAAAIPVLAEHGVKAVDKLWAHFRNYIRNQTGHDTGIDVLDWSSNNPTMPYKKFNVPGVNDFIEVPFNSKPVPSFSFHDQGIVNCEYIASVFCPEDIHVRRPGGKYSSTQLLDGQQDYVFACTSSGDLQIVIQPDFIVAGAQTGTYATTSNFFLIVNSAFTGFNSATGAVTAAQTFGTQGPAGPLNSIANTFVYGRLCSFSVQLFPIVSNNNNQGSVQLAYWPYSPKINLSAGGGLAGLNYNSAAPVFVTGNMGANYRIVHIPEQQAELLPYTSTGAPYDLSAAGSALSDVIVIQGSALYYSSGINNWKITISYNFEIVSTSSALQFVTPSPAGIGEDTTKCINDLVKLYPALLTMSGPDANEFAFRLKNSGAYRACDVHSIAADFFMKTGLNRKKESVGATAGGTSYNPSYTQPNTFEDDLVMDNDSNSFNYQTM